MCVSVSDKNREGWGIYRRVWVSYSWMSWGVRESGGGGVLVEGGGNGMCVCVCEEPKQ